MSQETRKRAAPASLTKLIATSRRSRRSAPVTVRVKIQGNVPTFSSTGPKQTITVQHVTLNNQGGQAIVGSVGRRNVSEKMSSTPCPFTKR